MVPLMSEREIPLSIYPPVFDIYECFLHVILRDVT